MLILACSRYSYRENIYSYVRCRQIIASYHRDRAKTVAIALANDLNTNAQSSRLDDQGKDILQDLQHSYHQKIDRIMTLVTQTWLLW
jgi:hypothetical protein